MSGVKKILREFEQPQNRWKKLDGEPINIFASEKVLKIIAKLNENTKPLSTICNIVSGLTPYRPGYGKPPQPKDITKTRIFDADYKVDNSYRPILRGSDIEKYLIKWNGKRWIKYGDNLAEPRYSANFDAPEKL